MSITNGDRSSDTPKTPPPIFHDNSLSRDRGYTHCMTPSM